MKIIKYALIALMICMPIYPKKPWGYHTQIDIRDCNHKLITDPIHINQYIISLCDLIGMKRYGKPVIINFGLEPRVNGYSMFQLIETSNISGHFANQTNRAYIDIFSCKEYDFMLAVRFTTKFFEGSNSSYMYQERP